MNKNKMITKNGIPDYGAMPTEKLIINAWYAPTPTLEKYQQFVDCGFDRIFLIGHCIGGKIGLNSCNQLETNPLMDEALTLCDQVGIKAYIDASECAKYDTTKETGEKAFLDLIEQYKKHPSFLGVCYDEPVINSNTLNGRWGLKELSPVIQSITKQYPSTEFMVNLNPTTNLLPGWFMEMGWGAIPPYSYEEYLEAQVQYINSWYKGIPTDNWISADDYPLFIGNDGKKFLKETWLECLGYLAVLKRDTSDMRLKTNFFLQSMPFESNMEWTRNRVPTYHDLRLQMYTLMAFGYDSLSFFCYATPEPKGDFTEEQVALIDRAGNPTPTYEASKKAIGEIKKFANTYMHFNKHWKGVYTVLGEGNTSRVDFDNVNRIGNGEHTKRTQSAKIDELWLQDKGIVSISATQDTLVGCMQDSWENPGLMLVNYNDTSQNKISKVTMQFQSGQYNKALVYIDGIQYDETLVNDKLNIQLGIGEGVFIVPYKR